MMHLGLPVSCLHSAIKSFSMVQLIYCFLINIILRASQSIQPFQLFTDTKRQNSMLQTSCTLAGIPAVIYKGNCQHLLILLLSYLQAVIIFCYNCFCQQICLIEFVMCIKHKYMSVSQNPFQKFAYQNLKFFFNILNLSFLNYILLKNAALFLRSPQKTQKLSRVCLQGRLTFQKSY